ncbi:hypothetical protein NG726_41390, partial [Pseudomonas sp. MOB-449]|nr:hypothetical protein [Pseudomonas sp. MOB-449]
MVITKKIYKNHTQKERRREPKRVTIINQRNTKASSSKGKDREGLRHTKNSRSNSLLISYY